MRRAVTRLSNPPIQYAAQLLERAIAIEPGSATLHAKLGTVFELQGRESRALEHYREALGYDPEFLPAANALAWLLATAEDESLRSGAEALRWAEQCNRATRFLNPTFLTTLAAAHSAAGDLVEAQRVADRVMELTPASQRGAMRARLDEFERPPGDRNLERTRVETP